MKKSPLMKFQFLSVMLWFCIAMVAIAQTPETDIDSITEDAYQRMLERQAVERASDTLRISESESVVSKLESKERSDRYDLMGVFVIVGILLLLWYYRRLSKTKGL